MGIARAKRLKNKVVIFGTVERGSFSKNSQVEIEQSNSTESTSVLDAYVYDCEENTIDVCLRANMGKHRLTAGERGCWCWIMNRTLKLETSSLDDIQYWQAMLLAIHKP